MRRGRRRGFVLLFGIRPVTRDDGPGPQNEQCPVCKRVSQFRCKRSRNWFTLFFIPVFPVSGAERVLQCQSCGAMFTQARIPGQSEMQTAGNQPAPPPPPPGSSPAPEYWQRAISLYNSMRECPGDSALLHELLELYGSMQEYAEALSTARHFPAAMEASPLCLTTLGKLQLAAGQAAEAVGSLKRAISKNSSLAEAHYYLAAACLSVVPPDTRCAISSARSAMSAGIRPAADLLRRAEELARAS